MLKLKILLLEANLPDAEGVEAALVAGEFDCELLRVDTRTNFVRALENRGFDLILADCTLPDIDGIAALEIARNLRPETPLIFVSASIGEERAIATIEAGAAGFVLKQRLERLVPGVRRVLREVRDRLDRQRTEHMLLEQERLLKLIASGRPLNECLAAVCTAISHLNPRTRTCFLLADATGQTFERSIAPDIPPSFGQGLKDAPINDLCIGTCGEAVYRGKPISCSDIAKDDRWSREWRDLCVAHGILACHSQPLIDSRNLPVGSLMLCFEEARMPTDWEYQLANFGTQIASIAFDRDRSNLALQESETKYRTLFESIDRGFCICEMLFDSNGEPHNYRFIEVNSVFETITGFAQVTGKTIRELIPQIETFWIDTYAKVTLTGEPVRIEHQSLALNRWFEVNAFPIGDPQRHQFAALFADITDRKQAEEALRESENRFQQLTAASPSVLYTVIEYLSGLTEFEYLSPAFETIYEIPIAAALQNPRIVAEQMHPDDREPYRQAVERSLATMQPFQHEWRILTPSGKLKWLQANSRPERRGDRIIWHGILLEITDRKQSELDLALSEERFRTLANNISQLAWMADPGGWIFWYNQRWFEYTGTTLRQVLGWGWQQVHHPEHLDRVVERLRRCFETGEPWEDTFPLRGKDGEYRWFLSRAIPIKDAAGKILRWFGTNTDITDRKLAEAQLRESEERLRMATQTARIYSWEIDLSSETIYWGENAEAFLGFPANSLPEKMADAFSMVDPADVAAVRQEMGAAINTGDSYQQEFRFLNPETKAIVWVWMLGAIVRDASGTAVRMVGITQNITDRKVAELNQQFLNRLDRQLRQLSGAEAMAQAALSSLGEYLKVDRVWWDKIDLERGEAMVEQDWNKQELPSLIGTYRISNFILPELAELFRQGQPAVVSDVTTYPHTAPFAGNFFSLDTRACVGVPCVREGRWVATLVVHSRTVRQWQPEEVALLQEFIAHLWSLIEHTRAVAEVRRSEAELRHLANAMPQIVWISNADGSLDFINDRWTEYTGLNPEQSHDREVKEQVILPEDRAGLDADFARARETRSLYQSQFRLRQPDGSLRYFLTRATPIKDDRGQVRKWYGTSTDITELKQLEAQRSQLLVQEQRAREAAETANRLKDEFLAVLSHELRSPLNPILGWSRLLQGGKLNPTRQAEALATIERNAKLLSQLIEDLLDISRIMQGKLTLTTSPVNLKSAIAAALETVRLAAEAKQIDIVLDLEGAIEPIVGDAARLQQVVWNLLANAIKFTPKGGQVTVELRQVDLLAQIRVADTGKGINAQFLPDVFEYFRQEDGSTTRKFGGLGLGLAIVRQIVEMHGGTVAAESPGEGQGSAFTVSLPLLC